MARPINEVTTVLVSGIVLITEVSLSSGKTADLNPAVAKEVTFLNT